MATKAKTKKTAASAATRKKRAPATGKKAASEQAERSEYTIVFDSHDRKLWFTTTKSENDELRHLKCTEAELIKKAHRASGVSPEQIIRTGTQAYAKRLLANAANADPAGAKGIAGANDNAFRDAYNDLKKDPDKAITPSRIAYRASQLTENPTLARAYRSAERWLKLHHPEVLAASAATAK